MLINQYNCMLLDLNDEEEICADLEDLQRKVLSISLSSLSHMSEIGKGKALSFTVVSSQFCR